MACSNGPLSHISVSPGIGIFNPRGAGLEIFMENYVNTMTADPLAPCVARTSTAMVLIMYYKKVVVFY